MSGERNDSDVANGTKKSCAYNGIMFTVTELDEGRCMHLVLHLGVGQFNAPGADAYSLSLSCVCNPSAASWSRALRVGTEQPAGVGLPGYPRGAHPGMGCTMPSPPTRKFFFAGPCPAGASRTSARSAVRMSISI